MCIERDRERERERMFQIRKYGVCAFLKVFLNAFLKVFLIYRRGPEARYNPTLANKGERTPYLDS